MPLIPGAPIDELRSAIGESEQRRQAAEVKLADCERRLGTARQRIAAQYRRIGWLTSEVARLRAAAAPTPPADCAHNTRQFFSSVVDINLSLPGVSATDTAYYEWTATRSGYISAPTR